MSVFPFPYEVGSQFHCLLRSKTGYEHRFCSSSSVKEIKSVVSSPEYIATVPYYIPSFHIIGGELVSSIPTPPNVSDPISDETPSEDISPEDTLSEQSLDSSPDSILDLSPNEDTSLGDSVSDLLDTFDSEPVNSHYLHYHLLTDEGELYFSLIEGEAPLLSSQFDLDEWFEDLINVTSIFNVRFIPYTTSTKLESFQAIRQDLLSISGEKYKVKSNLNHCITFNNILYAIRLHRDRDGVIKFLTGLMERQYE